MKNHRMHAVFNALLIVSLALPFLHVHHGAAAAPPGLLWIGPAGGSWSTSTNWSLIGDPTVHRHPQDGDAIVFSGAGTLSSHNDLAGLVLAGIGFNAPSVLLSGQAISVTTSINVNSGAGSIDFAVTLAPAITPGKVEMLVKVGSSLQIDGVISGVGAGINKTDSGLLTLAGNNTFDNGLMLTAGKVKLNHQNAAGSGTIQVLSGAVIEPVSASFILANPLQLAGSGPSGALHFEGTTLYLTGDINLSGATAITATAGQAYLSGAVTGTGPLILTGGAAYILTGPKANTFTGALRVTQGSLRLEKAAGVVAVPAELTIGDAISHPTVSVETYQDGQFSPSSMVLITQNGILSLRGTTQTIAGLDSSIPCTFNLDHPTGKTGSLTIQTISGLQNYLACDTVGKGSITVTGNGMQGFEQNPNYFEGTIEVKAAAAGYLYGFHTTGPYIVRSGAAGGLFYNADAGSLLVENSPFFNIEPDSSHPPQPKTGSLIFTGSTDVIFSINTISGPVLQVTGPISLGGVNLYACANTAYMPAPGETRTLIQNDSAQAIQGTFHDLPEGARGSLKDCWNSSVSYPMRIHYAAAGNDLTVTRLIRSTMTLIIVESDPQPGNLIHLVARMSLVDTLASPPAPQQAEFYDGNHLLGKADFSGEYAYFDWTDTGPGPHQLQARYPGDQFYEDAASSVTTIRLGKSTFLPYLKR